MYRLLTVENGQSSHKNYFNHGRVLNISAMHELDQNENTFSVCFDELERKDRKWSETTTRTAILLISTDIS